jgi:hypothetical protein
MIYLIRLSSVYSPKNRLHQDLIKFAKSMDRLLVKEQDLMMVLANCMCSIEELEKKYPRTNPTGAWVYKPKKFDTDGDHIIYIPNVATINFMASKGEVVI